MKYVMCVCFLWLNLAYGSIVTDRPDFTESSAVVPKKYLQLEQGSFVSKEGSSDIFGSTQWLWRYGFVDGLELRLATFGGRFEGGGFQTTVTSLGIKLPLSKPNSYRFEEAVIFEKQLFAGTQAPIQDSLGIKYCVSVGLTDAIALGANVNILGQQMDNQWTSWLQTSVSGSVAFDDAMSGFLEGYLTSWETDAYTPMHLRGGMMVLLNDDCQWDILIDKPLYNALYSIECGVSVRGIL